MIRQSFRILFKRMIVKNRLDLTFIIGNENVTNLNLSDLKKDISWLPSDKS